MNQKTSQKQTGKIQVDTAHIFPIIKKWLYSEHDIFLRELVANATDAISKRTAFSGLKNQKIPEGNIEIVVDKKKKTIVISDNGIGMTKEEVEKYIAQLAFSSARDFMEQIEKSGGEGRDIIGKFGLGFYSSFMAADKVVLDTLSMNEGATPVSWECSGETDYVFGESQRKSVGTSVTLFISKDNEEFLNGWKVVEILQKYCRFMPYKITIVDESRKSEKDYKPHVVNEGQPLWKKEPKNVKDEEYKEFFRKLHPMEPEPLFWLHLKVDHPFVLEGILYFPKINPTRPFHEHNIGLYCKQVFVSDNVKDVIPEFLRLLRGVIDSVDIPLNVSRSSLQGDPNVKKISNYIVKKVAEALKKLYKNDRKRFESIWPDVDLFVKYGVTSDEKFDKAVRDIVLFRNLSGKFTTFEEYKNSIPEKFQKKLKDKILYFEKGKADPALCQQLKTEGLEAVETNDYIDPHFIQYIETNKKEDSSLSFCSVDSEVEQLFDTETVTKEDMKIKDLFESALGVKDKDKMEVEIRKFKNTSTPAYFKIDEKMKRLGHMARSMGQDNSFPVKRTLVINPGHDLIQNALKIHEKNKQLSERICHHVEDLAYISSDGLKNEEKENFVRRSEKLIQELSSLAFS